MLSAWARIRQIYAERGPHGLARFARKAAWERLPLRPVTMPFGPGHLQVEVSGKCNLKCPMCPRTFSDKSPGHGAEVCLSFVIHAA